jgi:hypothetical protein
MIYKAIKVIYGNNVSILIFSLALADGFSICGFLVCEKEH